KGISFSGHDCGTGFAFVNDAQGLDAFGKLARYEATLSRRFFKCFRDLRKLRQEGWGQDDDGDCSDRTDDANDQAFANSDGDENLRLPGASTTAVQAGSSSSANSSSGTGEEAVPSRAPEEPLKDDALPRPSLD